MTVQTTITNTLTHTVVKKISRPSIVSMAAKAADKSSGIHSIGAVITLGTTKPVAVGYNTNKRTAFRFGSRRLVTCSQHAEMSVASRFLNSAQSGKLSRVRPRKKVVYQQSQREEGEKGYTYTW